VRAYNQDVVLDLIADELSQRGRGAQTRLAEAVGVRVQTVNKWQKRQTCPEPDKWPAIEEHFGLNPGTIRDVVGWGPADVVVRPGTVHARATIGEDERNAHARIDAVETKLANILADLVELSSQVASLEDLVRSREGRS
jgi:hypothetical protein